MSPISRARRERPTALRTLLLSLALVAFGGYTGRTLLDSANAQDPSVLATLHAHADPALASRPTNARVVIVVIDGLGERAFAPLVDSGALGPVAWRASIDSGVPSLSRPVYHVLLTGVPQQVAGIRSNSHQGRARADTIADRVRDAGGTVAFALDGVPWFFDLAGRDGDARLRGRDADDAAQFARIYATGARLIVLHLIDVDHAGHLYGAASPEYAAAARHAVDTVRALRDAVKTRPDAANTTWFVGADHGHTARGGHGGPEMAVRETLWVALDASPTATPMVPSGRAPATRLAPTFAAALDLPPPREALAAPLPLPSRALRTSPALATRIAAVDRALAAAVARDRRALALRSLVCAALALSALAFARVRRPGSTRRILAALSVTASACATWTAVGPGVTISAIRTQHAFIVHSVIALTLGALLAWPLARRLHADPRVILGLAALPPALALAISAGSTGSAAIGPIAALVLPATGLVPAGVALAALIVSLYRGASALVFRT